MLFNDIAGRILSLKNCSLTIKKGGGALFISDLHKFVKMDVKIVSQIKDKHNSQQAKMIKENLYFLLENYDKLPRGGVGVKPKK